MPTDSPLKYDDMEISMAPSDKNPVQLNSTIPRVVVARHRHFSCRFYNECLLHPALNSWVSFTCRQCGFFDAAGAEAAQAADRGRGHWF